MNDNLLRRELKRIIRQHPEINSLIFVTKQSYTPMMKKRANQRECRKSIPWETKPEATQKPDRGEIDKFQEVIKRQEHNIDSQKMNLCNVEVNCLLDTWSMVTTITESFYRDYIEPVYTDMKIDVKLNLKPLMEYLFFTSDI